MKKALVTGANGFIGSCLCAELLKRKIPVTAIVRRSSDLSYLKGLDVRILFSDIEKVDSLDGTIGQVDTIFHIAGLASDWGPYANFQKANVEGTLALLRLSKKIHAQKTVILSSLSVMGFGHKKSTEDSPKKPQKTAYVRSKLEMETKAQEFAKRKRIPLTILRPGDVFGMHDRTTTLKLLDALEKGQMGFVNSGRALLSPLYIDNLIQAMLLAAIPGKGEGEIFNISDDVQVTWKNYIQHYCDALGIKTPTLNLPFPLANFLAKTMEFFYTLAGSEASPPLTHYRICHAGKDYHFDISKAKKELGYAPSRSITSHIRRTVHWYKNQKQEKKRILITGVSGLWGNALEKHLSSQTSQRYEIFGTVLSSPLHPKQSNHFKMELTDRKSIKQVLSHVQPDIIIHTAAISRITDCEKNPVYARAVNVEGTKELIKWANLYKAKLIFFSTDLVYNGEIETLHSTEEMPKPRLVYEKTKWEAEKIIVENCYDYLILRTALSYGPTSREKSSFTSWMLNSLKKGDQLNLFTDQYRTPLSTYDGTKAIEKMLRANIRNKTINFGGIESCSRYEFGIRFVKVFGFPKPSILPITYSDFKEKHLLPNRYTSMDTRFLRSLYTSMNGIDMNLKRLKKDLEKIRA